MTGELWAAVAIWGALAVYALTGGADFGGGVWDLLASGPRARAQREAIRHALSPIWEANHVWLIFAVVLLFTAFPRAFAAVAVSLHLPLTVALIGIVLRGSAFAFRGYFAGPGGEHRWGRVFAAASVVTPVALGTSVGALAAGRVRFTAGRWADDFLWPWLDVFSLAVGFFALALFSFLAAVYLTMEAKDPALREDFRRRALAAGVATGALAWACVWLSGGAPLVRSALTARAWTWAFHAATGAAAVAALGALWVRRYAWARALAVVQVLLVLAGWALGQFPYLVPPDMTLWNAAAPASVRGPLLAALAGGFLLTVPCLFYLFYVFKRETMKSG